MRKRGQTEIIGILIVVFILSIGMFYVVGLKLSQRSPDTFNAYQDTELAHAMILALLNSDMDGCGSGTLYDNIKQLGRGASCDNMGDVLEEMMDSTIGSDALNRVYYYEINHCSSHEHTLTASCIDMWGPSDARDEGTGTNACAIGDFDTKANIYPVETTTGVKFYFRLQVCRT